MSLSFRLFVSDSATSSLERSADFDESSATARQLDAAESKAFFRSRRSVCTIGAFDGVHLGHQTLLQRVVGLAKKAKDVSCVVLFEPQPNEFFFKSKTGSQIHNEPPARLMNLREKLKALFALNIDCVLCLHFNESLRDTSASDFAQIVLAELLHVKHLVIGDDFQFGKNREGNFAGLLALGKTFNFEVEDSRCFELPVIDQSLKHNGLLRPRVSSTRIRTLLSRTDISGAARLLGQPFSLCGRVVYGKQLGRTLGFPTANVFLRRDKVPISGVFAVACDVHKGAKTIAKNVAGIANVGNRPTVDSISAPILEVHLLADSSLASSAASPDGQAINLYGRFLTAHFLDFIRPEKKFNTLEQLQTQIELDVQQAKNFHAGAYTRSIL